MCSSDLPVFSNRCLRFIIALSRSVKREQTEFLDSYLIADQIALLAVAKIAVLRDGQETEVLPSDLVQDDVLVIRAGDQIPVDGTIVGESKMEVDESALTGESDLVLKLTGDDVLSGSFCVTGETTVHATGVGEGSFANKLTVDAREFKLEQTPLQREVNRLLRQLQQRLQRSRQALGNLAHALKAPLSLLTQDVESLPLANNERQRLAARLERIRQLVDRELRRARIAGEGPGQRFVPAAHVPELIDAVNQLYRERSLEISTSPLTGAMLPLDYEDMLELLGNLLDNACKWAARRVHLEITLNEAVTMSVADDGPGLAREAHDTLLQRGSRLVEQGRGHGLGLAIVRDLVDDYHGRLQLGCSTQLGGLEVRVTLPVESEQP